MFKLLCLCSIHCCHSFLCLNGIQFFVLFLSSIIMNVRSVTLEGTCCAVIVAQELTILNALNHLLR